MNLGEGMENLGIRKRRGKEIERLREVGQEREREGEGVEGWEERA